MNVICGIPEMNKMNIALGIFDGVHAGHKAVIELALADGPTAVFTFNNSYKHTRRLLTDGMQEEIFEKMGVETLIRADFNAIRELTPEEFVRDILKAKLNSNHVFCGSNYRFGKNASGDVKKLSSLCSEYGIQCTVAESVKIDGAEISSTRIRKLLSEGNVSQVYTLLGRPFGYKLTVVSGQRLGRTLGTPTFNQHFPSDFCVPRFGAYASVASFDGNLYPAVTNIGVRPTVGADAPLSETWIPDFSGDLYGKEICVYLIGFLREEKKFTSLEQLKQEIIRNGAKAVKTAKRFFDEGKHCM